MTSPIDRLLHEYESDGLEEGCSRCGLPSWRLLGRPEKQVLCPEALADLLEGLADRVMPLEDEEAPLDEILREMAEKLRN